MYVLHGYSINEQAVKIPPHVNSVFITTVMELDAKVALDCVNAIVEDAHEGVKLREIGASKVTVYDYSQNVASMVREKHYYDGLILCMENPG